MPLLCRAYTQSEWSTRQYWQCHRITLRYATTYIFSIILKNQLPEMGEMAYDENSQFS